MSETLYCMHTQGSCRSCVPKCTLDFLLEMWLGCNSVCIFLEQLGVSITSFQLHKYNKGKYISLGSICPIASFVCLDLFYIPGTMCGSRAVQISRISSVSQILLTLFPDQSLVK